MFTCLRDININISQGHHTSRNVKLNKAGSALGIYHCISRHQAHSLGLTNNISKNVFLGFIDGRLKVPV